MQHEGDVVRSGLGDPAAGFGTVPASTRPAVGNQLEAVQRPPHPEVQHLVTGGLPSRLSPVRAGDQHCGTQVLEVETQLVGTVPGVQGSGAPGNRRGQERHGRSRTVGQHDGDAVVGADTEGTHAVPEVHQGVAQPGVTEHRAVLGQDRRVVIGTGAQQVPGSLSHRPHGETSE